jgi:probable rRNA maturation factor
MILLDPDLEPDPAPKTNSVKRTGASPLVRNSMTNARDVRLPSAGALARFLAAAQAAVRLKGQVTVLLTTDAAIRKLNREFRGKNKATDVLSFPAEGVGAEGMAGDLAISVTTSMTQAAEQGHSLAVEIKVLVLHGLLHLAGFDHEVDDGKMARRERVLRARLGLPEGLIERAAGSAKETRKRRTSGAKAHASAETSMSGLKPGPTDRAILPSGAKARVDSASLIVGVKTPTYQPRSTAKAGRP